MTPVNQIHQSPILIKLIFLNKNYQKNRLKIVFLFFRCYKNILAFSPPPSLKATSHKTLPSFKLLYVNNMGDA